VRAHILIVDDNESDQLNLSFILKKDGYQCSIAKDGYEAIDFLLNNISKDPVTLVILDLNMPVLSGMATLGRIKETKAIAGIPVMVVSGKKDKTDVGAAIKAGAKDYLVKPVDAEILKKKVMQLLTDQRSDWGEISVPPGDGTRGYYHTPSELVSINEVSATFKSKFPLPIKETTNIYAPILEEAGINGCHVRVLDCKKGDAHYYIQFELVGLNQIQSKALRVFCRKIYAETKGLKAG
jgi:DNA-binding response OmpR family regulator